MITKIHLFHVTDAVMHFARLRPLLPDPYAGIILYSDLSRATIQARKNLNPITKILRNYKIIYKWGFPTKLMIAQNNTSHSIHTIEQGLKMLQAWNLLPQDEIVAAYKNPPGKIDTRWNTS